MLKKIVFYSLLLWAYSSAAASVDTVLVHSASMNKDLKAVIVTPESYRSGSTSYKVIYLLHGYTGNYKDWIERAPNLKPLADKEQVIFVCPDGANSWYIDSPIDKKSQYETYIANELVNWVDQNYRSVKSSKGRAITGLSMGGYGALYIAIKHTDIFGAAGSMSGGVDLCFKPKSFEKAKVLGQYEANASVWKKYSIPYLLEELKGKNLSLIMDCGASDFFVGINRSLDKNMLGKGIKHQYSERPGGHSWEFWNVSIQLHTQFFKTFFDAK